MDALSGFVQRLSSGNEVSVDLIWSDRLQMFEPRMYLRNPNREHYPTLDSPSYISKQVLNSDPPPEIREYCSTYYGAMMVGLANMYKLAAKDNTPDLPRTPSGDDDNTGGVGVPVLTPV